MNNPEQLMIARERAAAVREAVGCLEPKYQRLVERWADGATLSEHQQSMVQVAIRAMRCVMGSRDDY